jgi:hypothetical protein
MTRTILARIPNTPECMVHLKRRPHPYYPNKPKKTSNLKKSKFRFSSTLKANKKRGEK